MLQLLHGERMLLLRSQHVLLLLLLLLIRDDVRVSHGLMLWRELEVVRLMIEPAGLEVSGPTVNRSSLLASSSVSSLELSPRVFGQPVLDLEQLAQGIVLATDRQPSQKRPQGNPPP